MDIYCNQIKMMQTPQHLLQFNRLIGPIMIMLCSFCISLSYLFPGFVLTIKLKVVVDAAYCYISDYVL